MPKVLRVIIVAGVCSVAGPLFLLVVNKAAFLQGHDEVVVRQCGHLRLGQPEPARILAADSLPFAWLSEEAYNEAVREVGDAAPTTGEVDATLVAEHWQHWVLNLTQKDQSDFRKYHLRVGVWQNQALNEVVVVFGGTDPRSIQDWIANFRWFIPTHDDEYTLVIKEFVGDFAREYELRSAQPGFEFLKGATLIATGHSLGGGLAQEFAYGQYRQRDVPAVTKVYAFDASPVTGFFSVDKKIRDENRKGLYIDRIYERHEILAILRSFVNLVHRPSAHDPQVREIRFNFSSNISPVYRHSIVQLRADLERAAGKPFNAQSVKGQDVCPAQ